MHRLPDLPGRFESAGFSFDSRTLALACAVGGALGARLYTIDTTSAQSFHLLCDLSSVREVYSVAWHPSGESIALSVHEFQAKAVKPYQTCLYRIDAKSGKVLSRLLLSEERTPLDKTGTSIKIAWLNSKAFLATCEGDSRVFEMQSSSPQLIPLYAIADAKGGPNAHWLSPVSLGNDQVAVSLFERVDDEFPRRGRTETIGQYKNRLNSVSATLTNRLFVFESGREVRTEVIPALHVRPVGTGNNALLIAKASYFRSYSPLMPAQNGEPRVGELVRTRGGDVLAKVPFSFPFRSPGMDQSERFDLCLSLDSRYLLMFEFDSLRRGRHNRETPLNSREPFGRLVLVDFESLH
jgi:hypothetical protein